MIRSTRAIVVWRKGAVLVATTLAACSGPSQEGVSEAEAAPTRSPETALDDAALPIAKVMDDAGVALGSVAVVPSCGPEAVVFVRRGLALLHNMTHTEAETAFRRATEEDPACALGYWGQAASG